MEDIMSERRRRKNFFTKLNITSTSFVAGQRAQWGFNSVGLALLVESNNALDAVQYSFDGDEVHGDLTPLLPSEGIVFDNRFESNVWFRLVNGGRTALVRIEAWQHEA